jgi:cytochrome c
MRATMLLTIFALIALSKPVAGADAAAGDAVFNRCKLCHSVDAAAGTKVGPNLHDIFGRKAGTVDGFKYSAAMRQSGVLWTDDTLTQYLRNPREFIPGNNMAFPGIKDESEIANLLAYLHRAAE